MSPKIKRRDFIRLVGAAASAGAWMPKNGLAQTSARGDIKHLLYIHLTGGFRFTTAFNGDVASQWNPWGVASAPSGTEWGPSRLLARRDWITEDLAALNLRPMADYADEVAVVPCVDHEPLAGGADGNHGSGLQRYLTGYVGGPASIFTLLNYGLRERAAQAAQNNEVLLPAIAFGNGGMATGTGQYAAYRTPVIQGDGFDTFGFDPSGLPAWARNLPDDNDDDFRARLNALHYDRVDSYISSRRLAGSYASIFSDPLLKVQQSPDEARDGLSNQELTALLGDSGTGRNVATALRLFHFGCPAVFVPQGGYDYHSDEDDRLPEAMDNLSRIISGIRIALKNMNHPDGGSYWKHTLVVLGSEFGRTARGDRFNSAGGSDHNSDLATRWMSMPMMGGLINRRGLGGRRFGHTRRADLIATEEVYSYRSMTKTLMDLLGADTTDIFPGDSLMGIFE